MEENKALKVKDESYFLIAGWMITKLQLKGNALMVYAIIYGFSQDGESSFKGSRRYLCDFIGASKPTIDKALEELVERGLIIKESNRINDVLYNTYKVNLDVLDFTGGKETLPGGKEIAPNNIEYNIEEKENIIITNNIKEKNFKKPTLEELEAYINEKGYHFSASNFINYYDSVGWKIGKSPMKDWKAACRTWEAKYKNDNNGKCYKPKEISRETSYPEFDDVGYIR